MVRGHPVPGSFGKADPATAVFAQIAKLQDSGPLVNPNYHKNWLCLLILPVGRLRRTFCFVDGLCKNTRPHWRDPELQTRCSEISNSAIQQFRVRGHPVPGCFGKTEPPTVLAPRLPNCQISDLLVIRIHTGIVLVC